MSPVVRIVASLALFTPAMSPGRAASMSASPTPPPVNGLDIANYGTITGNDKWFSGTEAGTSAAKGQTFTTGGTPVLFKSITYQVTSSQQAAPTKQYTIRVGTISGTTFTQIHTETATQGFQWNGGEYMTWTLATPLELSPNTIYGVDVAMTGSTSSWQTGIPYINFTGNTYANGQRYISGGNGAGTSTLSYTATSDRIFHVDLEHPLNPSPDIGAVVSAGDITLSWNNLAPDTGADVWVDVWFGTDPGALAKVASAQQNLESIVVNLPGAATYYWRIDSYLGGAPTGAPLPGTLFHFIVTDSDGDGFPDAYELANTSPSSATGLNRNDDLEPDGLTNWQEYQLGLVPTDPDTDDDGINDGPELAGAGSRPPTDPAKPDTDGDGLSDGVETHTGAWSGPADTGTNPAVGDTDKDGLKDGVETNTGVFIGVANTGTHPLAADSDADGAGDWYEVTAAYTSPVLTASKPNIPYPLPAPDGSTGVTNKPVKVYILSGQSNMVGFGRVSGTGTGTLTTMVKGESKFPNLVTGAGGWSARADVLYRGVISALGDDVLKPQFGANTDSIGPELGFGHVMGWYHDEPVLLIKTSIGNRSLLWDCLPPGSPRFNYGANTYAGYGDSPNSWPIGGSPSPFVWYAGKQYDDFFLSETDMRPPGWVAGAVYPANCQVRRNGVVYLSKSAHTADANSEPGVGTGWATYWSAYSVTNVVDILDDFATEYPQWAAQGFEIAGFVWFQGNKDLGDPAAGRYEANLARLIKQVRAYYAKRYPGRCRTTTPFVIATGCGDPGTSGYGLTVANAQLAVSGDRGNYAEFVGNVKTMDTRGYWRGVGPSDQGYHYHHNAETYVLTGDALGRGMIELLETAPAATHDYYDWALYYPDMDLNEETGDPDQDDVPNGLERIWGLDPTLPASSRPLLPVNPETGTFSYTRRSTSLSGLDYGYQWSSSLDPSGWLDFTPELETSDGGIPVETVLVKVGAELLAEPRLYIRVKAE